jgi:hypothetical protein
MPASNWRFDPTSKGDDSDLRRDSPEDFAPEDLPPADAVNRFGTRISLLVLGVGLFIAAVWIVSRPSFEKCSALENVAGRNACYNELRNELLKPPAKGADIKTVQ